MNPIDFYLDVKLDNNELLYLIDFFDTKVPEEMPSKEAVEYWPLKIISFFEERIVWVEANNDNQDQVPVQATNDMDGDPQNVLCKIHFITICYCKFSN